jgi:hypothetical protein
MGDTMHFIRYLFCALLVATSVSAYYVTPTHVQYVSNGGGYYSQYGAYDGYRLTQPGPYPYPRSYRLVEDRLATGHYSGYSGDYYYGYTGGRVPQYAHGYGERARYYPQLNTVHYE